jgi:dynamin 1-like protein
MNNLIEAINKIQDSFARVKIPLTLDLPIIAVVGAQSTGKSSVLETIVGKDFLPRGLGIVTRRPLILQLHNVNDHSGYAIFGHQPEIIYNDFDAVREEIIADTNRVAGSNKEISPIPIILKIYSSQVLDLTLVDLPGLTKVPIQGQAHDIDITIRNIVVDIVKKENTLILAVSSGNADIATSDAIKLAREVDPKGNRTIGIITKLDIMDKGTNAMDILEGKLYPLKLGYIGVVCRSQKDIIDRKSMKDAANDEEKFFDQHPAYSKIKEKCGIRYLAKTLSKLLTRHIHASLPSLKNNINAALQERLIELRSYGVDFLDENKGNLKSLLLFMISKFTEYYQNMIDGRFIKDSTKELRGGARIHYIFHTVYANAICNITALDDMTDENIRTVLINAKSLHLSLFIPDKAFETLIREQSSKLLEPSLQCMQMVFEELQDITIIPDVAELLRFENLAEKLTELMLGVLNRCIDPTKEMIKNLIKIEKSYANMNHPDMIAATGNIISSMDYKGTIGNNGKEKLRFEAQRSSGKEENFKQQHQEELARQEQRRKEGGWFSGFFCKKIKEDEKEGRKKTTVNDYLGTKNSNVFLKNLQLSNVPSTREKMEIIAIKQLLEAYFNIIKKNVMDLVPKTIVTFLINKSKTIAQNELVSSLYLEKDIEKLMAENPEISEKRKECYNAIEALQEALKALNEINYGHTYK